MAVDRTTLFSGPGSITWDSINILSSDRIDVVLIKSSETLPVSGYGPIKPIRQDFRIEVTCRPAKFSDLAKLFPYSTTQIGASIYGATDKPLVVLPRDGTNSGFTIANAAITRLPGMNLSARPGAQGTLGQIQWTGLVGNDLDPADIASYVAVSSTGALPAVTLTDLVAGRYLATWGALADWAPRSGFAIEFDLRLEPKATNNDGTVDMIFMGLDARCTVEPEGLTAANLLTLMGSKGMGDTEDTQDLVITGPRNVTLHKCLCRQATAGYGDNVRRIGALEFATVRNQTGGALTAVHTIAIPS